LHEQKLLLAEERQVLLAMGPTATDDALVTLGGHGHIQFLMPAPGIMRPASGSSAAYKTAQLAVSRLTFREHKLVTVPIDPDILRLVLYPCPSTMTTLQSDVDRYSGVTNLDASGPVASRHIAHPGNTRVVQALLSELNGMGYCAYTHSFTHNGLTLNNVIADLPGTGYFVYKPGILEKIRKLFLRYPLPDPPEPWIKPLVELVGSAWYEERGLDQLPPAQLRTTLETIFEFKPWYPWWLCPLYRLGSELVLVGCHLDSSANFDPGYNAAADPAPGADDDASGMAATLAMARWFMNNYKGKLRHTLRFCFFNAEESGFVGSQAYSAAQKAANAPIKAVVCLDMIGYNSDAARIFEIHAGYTDPSIRDMNVPIADAIALWAASLGALAPAQIYKGTNPAGGADRTVYDGAINRSDHAAFHQQGFPAVVVSEDFFINLPGEPGKDPNPDYHRSSDTVIDSAYASDITCAVAYAVKDIAQG
jgi:hypothetical protein